jgi:hypothetical protein
VIEAHSQLDVHAAHLALLAGWVLVFGTGFGWQWIRDHRVGPDAPERHLQRRRCLPWHFGIAASTVAAAAIHLSIIGEHFAESRLYGWFFLVLTIAQFGVAVLLVRRPSQALLKSVAASSVAIVLLWLATRTIGIPAGPAAGELEPFGLPDVLCSAFEFLAALLVIPALLDRPAISPVADLASPMADLLTVAETPSVLSSG